MHNLPYKGRAFKSSKSGGTGSLRWGFRGSSPARLPHQEGLYLRGQPHLPLNLGISVCLIWACVPTWAWAEPSACRSRCCLPSCPTPAKLAVSSFLLNVGTQHPLCYWWVTAPLRPSSQDLLRVLIRHRAGGTEQGPHCLSCV